MQNVRQSYKQEVDSPVGNIAMQNETIKVVLFCASLFAGVYYQLPHILKIPGWNLETESGYPHVVAFQHPRQENTGTLRK
jgi:hypothetical protein